MRRLVRGATQPLAAKSRVTLPNRRLFFWSRSESTSAGCEPTSDVRVLSPPTVPVSATTKSSLEYFILLGRRALLGGRAHSGQGCSFVSETALGAARWAAPTHPCPEPAGPVSLL